MEINLSSVGMEKGRQYETVITTLSPEGKRNAAPIGVICTCLLYTSDAADE